MAEAAPVQSTEFSPLQVPEVLKKIFEGSSVADLMEFRQVCRSWNLESSKVLRKSAQLQICASSQRISKKRLDEFMTLVDNEMCTFTKKVCFPESVFFRLCDFTQYNSRFWRQFGSQIRILDLGKARFLSPDDIREAVLVSCPNLEELTMSFIRLRSVDSPRSSFPDYDFSNEETDANVREDPEATDSVHQAVNKNLKFLKLHDFSADRFPFSLFKPVFNLFPNLEALYVTCGYYDSQNDAIFSALDEWLQEGDGRGEKLKEIGLSFSGLQDPDKTAEILTSGKLRLETLEFLDFAAYKDADAAQTILMGHAATLKKLSLEGSEYDDQSTFPLANDVVLGALEEMKLLVVGLTSTSLWKCVPNLKKLVLERMFFSHIVRHVSIQELRNVALTSCVEIELERVSTIELDDRDGYGEVVRKLTALLPNVRKLKLQLHELNCSTDSTDIKRIFAIVCEAFSKLVELRVSAFTHSRQSLDSAITGMDWGFVEKVNRELKKEGWKPICETREGIAILKDLKVLSIQCDKGLGYSSAVAGIQRLPQLQQLQLDFQEVDEEDWTGVWKPLLAQFPWKGN